MGHGRVQLNHPLVVDASALFVPLVRSGMWPTIKFHSPAYGDTLTPQANHKTSVLDTLRQMHAALAEVKQDLPEWLVLVVQQETMAPGRNKDEDSGAAPQEVKLAPEYAPLPLTPLQAAKLSELGAKGEVYLSPSQRRLLAGIRGALERGDDFGDPVAGAYLIRDMTARADALRERLRAAAPETRSQP